MRLRLVEEAYFRHSRTVHYPSSIRNPTEAWVMGWSGPVYNSHSMYVAHVNAWSRSWRVQG